MSVGIEALFTDAIMHEGHGANAWVRLRCAPLTGSTAALSVGRDDGCWLSASRQKVRDAQITEKLTVRFSRREVFVAKGGIAWVCLAKNRT